MSKREFVIADTHFGHRGVCEFLRADGTKLRPWDNPDEMDEALIERWNSVVQPHDRVYVLGDLAINQRCIETVSRCNGRKVLVKGNHDIFRIQRYLPHFDDIRAYVVKNVGNNKRLIMSHIPVYEGQLEERFVLNIHGHLHSNVVMKGHLPDSRYVCVSVEHTNYTPILLEEAIARGAY